MTTLSQIRPVSLREQVVEQVRAAIIEGRLKPKDHIAEATLTQQLGVSRTPVREALILLEREGLVVASPNRGCFVRAFTAQDVDEIFSMRTMLENLAGEQIIHQLTQVDYDWLRHAIEAQRQAIAEGDLKAVRRIDMGFHEYLVNKSNHTLLLRNWREIVAQIAAVLYLRAEAIDDFDEYQAIRDHTAIVEAYEDFNLARLVRLNRDINERVAAECRRAVTVRLEGEK